MASAHVLQGGCLGALVNGAGTCTRADPAAAALDTVCPTVGGSAVGNGQAGDLELNAVDGCGGHCGSFRLGVL